MAQPEWNPSIHIDEGMHNVDLFAESDTLIHQAHQQRNNLTFTTQDAAQRAVIEVLARHKGDDTGDEPGDAKRKVQDPASAEAAPSLKKQRAALLITDEVDDIDDPASVAASNEGLSLFHDNDVLSGRGGGTNVHPGNRLFRDLINVHRRAYLKARKNDKPSISRAIVKEIRRHDGRFLKRDEKTGLWFEIGDDAAREKTSQALRQRAPEMRKILFDTERDHARQEVGEQIRQQQLYSLPPHSVGQADLPVRGGASMMNNQGLGMLAAQQSQNHQMNHQINQMGMFNPLFQFQNKQNVLAQSDPYAHMTAQGLMTAALLGGNMNRFTSNGT